jgi:CubicO group peptidase (beta-lactamase class C family)
VKAVCLFVTVAVTVAAATAAGDQLDELLAGASQPAPGAVFAAARNGEIVEEGAVGLASLELGVPLTAESVLNAGSIAKWFTAYAVLRLVETGRLSLDGTVSTYLDSWPDHLGDLTLAQLLQHTSGLKDYWSLAALAGQHAGDRVSQAAAVAMIRRQDELNFVPGERHLYSNSGYILLAEIISAVTGERYADWMRKAVFESADMRASLMLDDPFRIVPGLASSYRRRGDEGEARETFRREPLNSGVVGSGNLLTTVGDLLRWASYMEAATLDGEPALSHLSRQPVLSEQPLPGYGMGVSLGQHRGYRSIEHGGANAGYRASLLMLPDVGIHVAVLANAGHLDARAIAQVLADRALRRAGLLEAAPVVELPGKSAQAPRPLAGHDAYTGMFLLENGLLLRVRDVSGQLVALISGSPHALRWDGGHEFALQGDAGRLEFALNGEEIAEGVTLVLPEARLTGERREPLRLQARQLRALSGEYLSRTLSAVVFLTADDDGGLRVEQPSGGRVSLTPLTPDVFVEWDTADFLVQFQRDRRGRVRSFAVSLERARDVRFERVR